MLARSSNHNNPSNNHAIMVGPSNAEIDFLANSYISCGLFTVEYFILDSEEFCFEEPLYRDKICFVFKEQFVK